MKKQIKIKLDENLGISIFNFLSQKNTELNVETVISEGLKGARDEEIFISINKEKRILITLDRGFGNFINYPINPNIGIIILKPNKNFNTNDIKKLINKFLNVLENNNPYGKLWIISKTRIREYNPDS